MSECPKSGLPRASCALPCCRGLAETKTVTGGVGHPFRARYDGRCGQPGCRNEIAAGDLVRYVDDMLACGGCS